MNITHSYKGLGLEYSKRRPGTPKFATFMFNQVNVDKTIFNTPLNIVEFGIGSGQQTEFLEKELKSNGVDYYIIAFDKSFKQNNETTPGQFDILKERIKNGEIN